MCKFSYLPAFFMSLVILFGCSDRAAVERGRKLFNGEEPLQGRLNTHQSPLPAATARCVNCHRDERKDGQFAPLLTKVWLTQKQARRGGPAYAYDKATFCKTIRTGVDPEYVILLRTMPRYELNDEQCNALWTYLTRGEK